MLNHKGTETLETERLILRKFELSDAANMYKNWASDDDVTRYLTWPSHGSVKISQAITAEWVNAYKDDAFYQWAIVAKELNEVIGSISVVALSEDSEHCEIGYCIGKDFWNKGIVTEAFQSVIKFLFYEVGINRIEAKHDTDNPASGKVMKKVGMQFEGTKRSIYKNLKGEFVDCHSYSILKDEEAV